MTFKLSRTAFVAFCLASLITGSAFAQIELKPGRKQLFLDDHVVEQVKGLRSTMHQPTKRGAVLKPDIPSDGSRVETYGTVPMWVPEERVFKMVYLGFPMENHSQIGPALATSRDGIHWEKPSLGQNITVRGSTDNNRIVVDRKQSWPNNALWNVVIDPDDPDPNRRFKALYGTIGRVPVVSPDCIHWTKLPVAPIPSSDTSNLVYDRERRRFLAFVKGTNKHGRAANLSISTDFENWSKPRPCFGADDTDQKLAIDVIRRRVHDRRYEQPLFLDPDPALGFKPPVPYVTTWKAECYAFPAFPYEGLYIGLPMMYYPTGQSLPRRNNSDGFDHIQLVMSRDLTHWKRLGDRRPFIGPSRIDRKLVGVYDRQQLIPPNSPVPMGDELWFYYIGAKTRIPPYAKNPDGTDRQPETLSAEERADLEDGWMAMCLAVLRRDGFVSLDADKSAGVLLTKPLKLSGQSLFLNLAAAQGSARVEILDENNKPLPGYSGADAAKITGDNVRLPVRFGSGKTLSELAGQTVRLKIHLQRASLYAFWVE